VKQEGHQKKGVVVWEEKGRIYRDPTKEKGESDSTVLFQKKKVLGGWTTAIRAKREKKNPKASE